MDKNQSRGAKNLMLFHRSEGQMNMDINQSRGRGRFQTTTVGLQTPRMKDVRSLIYSFV